MGTIIRVESGLYGLVDDLIEEIPFTKVIWKTGRPLPRKVYQVRSRHDLSHYPTLAKVTTAIEDMLGRNVNGMWLNYYTDGNDWCPYHKDSYGYDVASFSAGSTRDFCTKDDSTKVVEKYPLTDGDILFFDGDYNDTHTHSVPVRKRVTDPRVSVIAFLE